MTVILARVLALAFGLATGAVLDCHAEVGNPKEELNMVAPALEMCGNALA